LARIGILGGTFDPPHNGHIAIARAALGALKLSEVIFVPANIPPHKIKRIIATQSDRLAMLKLAVGNNKSFKISTIEIDRSGPSYTADTLTEFRIIYPKDELFLLIGADNVSDIEYWYQPERIAELAVIAAANRPKFSSHGDYADRIIYFKMPPTDISSTKIRDRIRAGKPISELVCSDVENYIIEHRLYQP
jgi:nicotinate-nucleotide adenylyltransferase